MRGAGGLVDLGRSGGPAEINYAAEKGVDVTSSIVPI